MFSWKVISLCEISHSHIGAGEDSSFLGCDTLLFGKSSGSSGSGLPCR